MRKIIAKRALSFLENNLAVGYFCVLIACVGISAAWAKFEALTAPVEVSATP